MSGQNSAGTRRAGSCDFVSLTSFCFQFPLRLCVSHQVEVPNLENRSANFSGEIIWDVPHCGINPVLGQNIEWCRAQAHRAMGTQRQFVHHLWCTSSRKAFDIYSHWHSNRLSSFHAWRCNRILSTAISIRSCASWTSMTFTRSDKASMNNRPITILMCVRLDWSLWADLTSKQACEFRHTCFRRDGRDLLDRIKRKQPASRRPKESLEYDNLVRQTNTLHSQVAGLQQRMEQIDRSYAALAANLTTTIQLVLHLADQLETLKSNSQPVFPFDLADGSMPMRSKIVDHFVPSPSQANSLQVMLPIIMCPRSCQ